MVLLVSRRVCRVSENDMPGTLLWDINYRPPPRPKVMGSEELG